MTMKETQRRLDSEYERMWLCPGASWTDKSAQDALALTPMKSELSRLMLREISPDQLGALERHIPQNQYNWEHHMMLEIGVPRHAIAPCIQCTQCGRYPEPRIITRVFIEESHEWDLRSIEDLNE